MSDDVPEVLVWDCAGCGQKGVADGPACANCGQAQPDEVELYPPEGAAEEKLLLGLWDCTSCEGKGVPGDVYSCPDCGAGRPEDVEFYRPDDAQEITSAKGKAAAKAGADWQCEYCDQWVAAVLDTCPSCAGGEIETGKRQEVKEEVIDTEALHAAALAASQAAAQASANVTAAVHAAHAPQPHQGEEEPGGSGLGCLVIAVLLGAFLCCAMFFGGSTKVGVKVTGHTWKRVQQVENLQVVESSGWERPDDAFDVEEERKVHHVDKVQDGTRTVTKTVTEKVKVGEERYKAGVKRTDLGNGRFKEVPVYKKRAIYETQTKQVPVEEPIYKEVKRYQTHFRYKVKRWVPGDARERSGEGLDAEWPEVSVSGANQRLGQKSATYVVLLQATEGGSTYRFECGEERWRSFEEGSVWTAVTRSGKVEDLKPFSD
jgi:hypothetical protein